MLGWRIIPLFFVVQSCSAQTPTVDEDLNILIDRILIEDNESEKQSLSVRMEIAVDDIVNKYGVSVISDDTIERIGSLVDDQPEAASAALAHIGPRGRIALPNLVSGLAKWDRIDREYIERHLAESPVVPFLSVSPAYDICKAIQAVTEGHAEEYGSCAGRSPLE